MEPHSLTLVQNHDLRTGAAKGDKAELIPFPLPRQIWNHSQGLSFLAQWSSSHNQDSPWGLRLLLVNIPAVDD